MAETLEAARPHVPHDVLANLLRSRTGTQGIQFPFTVQHHLPWAGVWLCVCLQGAGDGRSPRAGRSVTPQGNGLGWGLRSFI